MLKRMVAPTVQGGWGILLLQSYVVVATRSNSESTENKYMRR